MSKYRQAPRTDSNQSKIIENLRKMGYIVEPGHDDILVSKNGITLWVEVKSMDTWLKCGGLKAGTFKDSQVGLIKKWKGAYLVAWTTEQIVSEMERLGK